MVDKYRPASSLCSLSKVWEIVPASMHIFCRKIIPEQRGSMRGRAAEIPMFLPELSIVLSVHSAAQADVVYFDMGGTRKLRMSKTPCQMSRGQ